MKFDFKDISFEVEYPNPVPASFEDACCDFVQYKDGEEVGRFPLKLSDVVATANEALLLITALEAAAYRIEATIEADNKLAEWMPTGRPV